MFFQIEQVILWPKHDASPRVVRFEKGAVNVITGTSKTGKSAIIPIIDYCLGSRKCQIPVGVIRDECAWFGVKVATEEGVKLFARREPGLYDESGEMYIQDPFHEVPYQIEQGNIHRTEFIALMNELAGLPDIPLKPDEPANFGARPSFRDLVSFVFQPQQIVANPNVLFYKADSFEHREKLKNLFPYVLRAVDADSLEALLKLNRKELQLKRAQREQGKSLQRYQRWREEFRRWVYRARELELMSYDETESDDIEILVQRLRDVAGTSQFDNLPTFDSIDYVVQILERYRGRERELAGQVAELRQRYDQIVNVLNASIEYQNSIELRRERLKLSEWLNEKVAAKDSLQEITLSDRQSLYRLAEALQGLEFELATGPLFSDKMGREREELEEGIGEKLEELREVRKTISEFERESDQIARAAYRRDEIVSFVGELRQALRLYDDSERDARDEEVQKLHHEISELSRRANKTSIERRIEEASEEVMQWVEDLLLYMPADRPSHGVEFVPSELTVRVKEERRSNFLWQIGGGANWVSYHVAVTLGLMIYFSTFPRHEVPQFLVYDQPSQVFFPLTESDKKRGIEPDWSKNDEDKISLEKILYALSISVGFSGGDLQVILLDHAGPEIWRDIPHFHEVANWRGDTLVPIEWVGRAEY